MAKAMYVTTSSDQTSTSGDGVTSGSSSSDSTTGDSGSTEQSSSSTPTETTPIPTTTTTTTTVPPTTTTEPVTTPTPTPEPTTTPTEQPSPTTPTPPQTTPNTPNPQTTPVNQTPSPVKPGISATSSVILPSSLPVNSMSSIASSFILSSSGSPVTSSIIAMPSATGSCTSGQACVSGQYCSSGNMTCMTVLADGSACTGDEMCSSGHCSNAICIAAATSSKTSSGEIAGIVIGSIGGFGVAVGVLFCLRRRRKRQVSRMRGFTPSMALNGHLNDKNFYTDTRNVTAAERHKSDYSFTSEQAALESLSSMSMTMSPIGRQSAVYYRNNQMYNLSGTNSPFDDNDTYQTMSANSSQPALLSAVPPAMQSSVVRSSKFDFLQSAFAKRNLPEKHPIQVSEHENIWPAPAHSEVSSNRTSLVDGPNPSWQALTSQPPSRQGYASSDHMATTSNRMSSTTFGSGHHHVGVDDDESVIDSAYSPAQTHPQPVRVSPRPHNHNPFRPNKPAVLPRDAWSKEDEDGMNAYQYF
ncbi:hypothetical protein INT43_002971 [Umbelopsis isabellina]|uniref:Dickkopf N-terminal cysteine-rich domain-containing protein n=1 Tax=Mortierella isabellina TaxID=91625 RepID=A0A8H7PCX3_MORIS|nr:hypothetical protein INT43_002971 [Umbelopsis isabellina]